MEYALYAGSNPLYCLMPVVQALSPIDAGIIPPDAREVECPAWVECDL